MASLRAYLLLKSRRSTMRPIKSGAALRLKDRLRPVFPAAPAQYVFCDQIYFIIMFSDIMFIIYVLSSMLESCMLGLILVMKNLVRNLNLQLSIFPTIQKPYNRQSVDLTMAGSLSH